MHDSIVSSLATRMARVQRASHQTFVSELASLREFIQRTGPLLAIARSIDDAAPTFDPAVWVNTVGYGRAEFPNNEAEYMKVLQHLLYRFTADLDPVSFGHNVFFESNFDQACSRVAGELLLPYATYLEEHLGSESESLHMLARYRQRVEWFTRNALFDAFQADTSRGEALYDRDLRRFLFDEGIDNPSRHLCPPLDGRTSSHSSTPQTLSSVRLSCTTAPVTVPPTWPRE